MKQLLVFVCFFTIFFEVQCMSLENALAGKEKLRITTLTRSVSNNLIINTERKILQSAIEYLATGEEHKFSEFEQMLIADIKEYLKIPDKIKVLRKEHESELHVMKMQNLLEGDVSVTKEALSTFVTTVLANGGIIKNGDELLEKLFEKNANEVWEHLSQFDDGISEVDIRELLKVTDSDVLKYAGDCNDEAIYQAISEIISVIKKDFPDLYIESDLQKTLCTYYCKLFNTLMSNIEEAQKFYASAVTMLVTNEYFWGKVPIEMKEATDLMTEWSSLPGILFCSNFLLIDKLQDPSVPKKFADDLTKLYIPSDYDPKKYEDPFKDPVRMRWSLLMDSRFFKGQRMSAFQEYLEHLGRMTSLTGIFKNESMIFWQAKPLTVYDKATYIDEQDDLFQRGFIYMFGLGIDSLVGDAPEAKTVYRLVSTQICRDLLAKIRVKDEGKQRYHILQSNTIEFDGCSIPPNVEYAVHVNFGFPAIVYRRAVHFSSIPVDKRHMRDQVGPFDWHLNFSLGSSNYSIQTVTIGK